MTVLKSAIDTKSEAFRENDAGMRTLVEDLKAKVAEIKEGGGAKARERHLARGKMLTRERVRTLLDTGSPFLELGQLAAYGMYDGEVPSAGLITGIGVLVWFVWVVITLINLIRGATAAGSGEYFRYPMVIRFLS